MKQKNFRTRRRLFAVLLPIPVLVFMTFACSDPSGLAGGPYSLDDDKLLPFAAMYEIDRERFCLADPRMDGDLRVQIETDHYRTYGYDVMLHMYGDGVSRTVAFVREDGQYVWIGEQETHYSGRTFMTIDGELSEHITVTYHERPHGRGSGWTGLIIHYSGEEENVRAMYLLNRSTMLTCEQASAIMREWDARKTAPDDK